MESNGWTELQEEKTRSMMLRKRIKEKDEKIDELEKEIVILSKMLREEPLHPINVLDVWCDANLEVLGDRIEREKMFSRKRECLKHEIMVFDKVKMKLDALRKSTASKNICGE